MAVRTAHAFTDDLARMDAVATADAVRRGDLHPREILDAAIARAQSVDPTLRALVVTDYQRARDRGRAAAAGPFAGVPMVVKDMPDIEGLPTRNGSDAFHRAGPARATCPTLQQMFDMGLVSLGKTALSEFGLTPSTEFPNGGATHNPWNLDHSVGGSSGGSAALVAAGVVPLAHAMDGGGSIRIPAACCGLVGHKPSRGRLLPAPDAKLLPLDSVAWGVVSRSVRDTALFYAEAEKRFRNPRLPGMGRVSGPPERRLRVGATADTLSGLAVDAPTRRVFDQTLALLEDLGHRVEPVRLPVSSQFAEDFKDYYGILAFAVSRGGRVLFGRHFDRGRLMPFTLGFARRFAENKLRGLGAVRRLRRSGEEVARFLAGIDVVLTPTVTHVTPRIGHFGMALPYETLMPRIEDWVAFTPLANATGIPSISLPLGHDEETNLPIGMMFSAGLGQDALLLQLALELEAARPPRRVA